MNDWNSRYKWTEKPTYFESERPAEKPPAPCSWCKRVGVSPPRPRKPGQGYCREHINEYQRTRKARKEERRGRWLELQQYANSPDMDPVVLDLMRYAFDEDFRGPGRPKGDNSCPRCDGVRQRMPGSGYCSKCSYEYQKLRERAKETEGDQDLVDMGEIDWDVTEKRHTGEGFGLASLLDD